MQQGGFGHLGPVAVVRVDRLGEPAQLATGACGTSDPFTVVQPERGAAERAMMLTGAGRAASAVHRYMDLVDDVKLVGEVAGEQPRQSRRHGRADDQRRPPNSYRLAELEQLAHVVEIVAHRNDRDTVAEQSARCLGMRSRVGQHSCIGDLGMVEISCDAGHHPGDDCGDLDSPVDDGQPEITRLCQGLSDASSGDPGADDCDDRRLPHASRAAGAHRLRHFWRRDSSRQPPCCGGTPPLPRKRSTPNTVAAAERAKTARRSIFTVAHCTAMATPRSPPGHHRAESEISALGSVAS